MRRISLALALFGAVAAGCSGGNNPSSSGSSRGVPGSTFTVQVRGAGAAWWDPVAAATSFQVDNGKVASADGRIDCGIVDGVRTTKCTADFAWDGAALVLTGTGSTGFGYHMFAGSCSGTADCTLQGNADKMVAVKFAATPGELAVHANFSDEAVHGPEYLKFVEGQAGAYQCTSCHGASLQGQGLAVSCASCHAWPLGPHFVAANFTGHASGTCARCHQGLGFRDFIGADGTASNVLDVEYTSTALSPLNAASFTPAPFQCDTCHNDATVLGGGTLNQHKFASGNVVTMDGATAICSQCHDGGRPGYEVSQLAVQIKAVAADAQLPTVDNKVVRAHYTPAASTLFGAAAANWYQYPGYIYTGQNQHGGKGSCTSCHNAHTGELPSDARIAAECGTCHFDELSGAPVANFLQLEESRQFGFEGDIDGDGNAVEPLRDEIDGLAEVMYAAIQAYAQNVAGAQICAYNNRYYILTDPGVACGTAPNATQYNLFTPRLLRAGYNYLLAENDAPGSWAHNPRYVIEVLFDTITDLNLGLGANAVPFSGKRAFNGHFGAAEDASPYAAMVYHATPPQGFTSGACYQCHGGQGGLAAYLASMPTALTNAVIVPANKVNAMQCGTCHTFGDDMKGVRSDIGTVYFPPQKNATQTPSANVVSFAAADLPTSFPLCGTCHSGRENGTTVDNAIAANYALSATGLTVTEVDPTGVVSLSVSSGTAAWSNNRYQNAKLTFASGANVGTTIIVKSSSSTPTGGGTSRIVFKTAPANPVAVNDTFDLTFDATTWGVGFTNPHYLGAAGVLLGSNAGALYQYSGQTYAGYPINWGANAGNAPGPHGSPHGAACTGCHLPKASKHTFEVDLAYCATCHTVGGPYDLGPKKLEVEEAADELYVAIQAAGTAAGNPVCYASNHPYWFADTNANGTCETSEAVSANGAKLSAGAAKAAYNFKWAHAEPGAYAHNLEYMMQALYDSIVDMGGTPAFTRP